MKGLGCKMCFKRKKQISLLIFIGVILPYSMSTQDCAFPQTVYDTTFHWRIMSPDHTSRIRHYRRRVTFQDADMIIDYITDPYNWNPSGRTLIYKCNAKLDEQTFLVSVHEENETTEFSCIQFLLRGLNVIQLKFGPRLRHNSVKLCSEETLRLMDAPMVYYNNKPSFWTEARNRKSEYNPCPLSGGYVLTKWFNESNHLQCKATQRAPVSIKVENECEKGEGLGFLGGSKDCPPVYPGFPFFCLADWTDGEYSYMVLVREHLDFDIPCFRYKTNHGDNFSADLFIDGVCDRTEDSANSRKSRHMILERYSSPEADLCSNDSPLCNKFLPPKSGCGWNWASFCRFTCHTCLWRKPWSNVTIPVQYQGTFTKDTFKKGKETIVIDAHYIHIPSLGKYRIFGKSACVEEAELSGMGESVEEFVFIQSFDNGCSPRMTIIQMTKRSPYVISIRLSVPVTIDWKLFQELSKEDIPEYGRLACVSGAKFQNPSINIRETYRPLPKGWFNLILEDESLKKGVQCVLPPYNLFQLTLHFGVTCEGHINPLSSQSFQVILDKCHSHKIDNTFSMISPNILTLDCLAAFKEKSGSKSDTQLIGFTLMKIHEKETVLNTTHLCWTFSLRKKNTIYWSHASDCDGNGEVYFFEYEGGVKQYIASLREAIQYQQQLTSSANSRDKLILQHFILKVICSLYMGKSLMKY